MDEGGLAGPLQPHHLQAVRRSVEKSVFRIGSILYKQSDTRGLFVLFFAASYSVWLLVTSPCLEPASRKDRLCLNMCKELYTHSVPPMKKAVHVCKCTLNVSLAQRDASGAHSIIYFYYNTVS